MTGQRAARRVEKVRRLAEFCALGSIVVCLRTSVPVTDQRPDKLAIWVTALPTGSLQIGQM